MFSKNLTTRKNEGPWHSLQNEFNDLISRFSDDWEEMSMPSLSHFVPKVDVKDLKDSYLVTAEIPGMKEDDINLSLIENVLTIEGEKKSETKDEGKGFWRSEISYGSFYRTIPLRDEVDDARCDANYKDGVLKVTLFKKEGAQKKSHKIAIGKGKETQH